MGCPSDGVVIVEVSLVWGGRTERARWPPSSLLLRSPDTHHQQTSRSLTDSPKLVQNTPHRPLPSTTRSRTQDRRPSDPKLIRHPPSRARPSSSPASKRHVRRSPSKSPLSYSITMGVGDDRELDPKRGLLQGLLRQSQASELVRRSLSRPLADLISSSSRLRRQPNEPPSLTCASPSSSRFSRRR